MNAKRSDAEMSEKEEFALKSIQWAVWGAVLIGLGFWVYVSLDSDEPTESQKRAVLEIQAETVAKLKEWAERDLRLAEMVLDGARTPSEKKEAELMYESAWKELEELRKKMVAIKSGDRMQR